MDNPAAAKAGDLATGGELSDHAAEMEIIHDEGDIMLCSGTKKFKVSSVVLTLASPYFHTMFKSQFTEAEQLRRQKPGEALNIRMEDDVPEAWSVLLHTLHYSTQAKQPRLSVDMQHNVAIV